MRKRKGNNEKENGKTRKQIRKSWKIRTGKRKIGEKIGEKKRKRKTKKI